MSDVRTSNWNNELPKQSVDLIRATLEDMRKHGLRSGLPQEHAFTLLEEIERLNKLYQQAEDKYQALMNQRVADETDEGFQARVYNWMAKCFMRPDSMLPVQRSFRFIEEALELVQASGTSREEVLRLVEYVYGRPAGDVSQEIGGVMVTLSGLATSFRLSMEYAGNAELARCVENTEKIRAKDLAKPQRSPLPGPTELKASEVEMLRGQESAINDLFKR